MLQAYYQPFYKLSALAQIYKETHCIITSFLNHTSTVYNSRIRAGTSYRGSSGSLHYANQIVQHPRYNYYTNGYDISVVRVSVGALLHLSSARNYW
jgi:hypothetical protein